VSVLDRFDLSGKTAPVTGRKRGIGRAMAEAGADIIGVSATLEAEGSDVGAAVEAPGRSFTGHACDFADREALSAFTAHLEQTHPLIDILVDDAGTIGRAAAAEHPDALWDEVIEVNLSARFVLTREIGRHMVERGSGKVIFTASLLTFQGGVTVPGYAASKGGIGQLTMAFANEWASKGVNVNATAPGYIRTDDTRALQDDASRRDAILARIPAGRRGEPDDFKGLTVFLASRAADYLHGTIVTVDGAWTGR